MFKELCDENRARHEWACARQRVTALARALAAGEDVAAELRAAETHWAALNTRLRRGDTPHFLALCVVVGLLIASIYSFGHGGMLTELWGTPENAYLQQYRATSARVWQTCQTCATPIAIGLFVWLGTIGFVQRRLERRAARILLRALIVFDLIINAALVLMYFNLLIAPLM